MYVCVCVCKKRMLMHTLSRRVAANNNLVGCVNQAEKCGQWESFQLRTAHEHTHRHADDWQQKKTMHNVWPFFVSRTVVRFWFEIAKVQHIRCQQLSKLCTKLSHYISI